MLHNRYLVAGGEDQSHLIEIALLRQQGNEVDEYTEDNRRVAELGLIRTSINTVWSQESFLKIKELLRKKKYDLVVAQNLFPLLSPSVYYAAKSESVPVVQFLRNYRLFCLNGLALRNNKPCEACLGRLPLAGIYHACYRESRAASAVVVAMLVMHRSLLTWQRKVDVFVALTDFSKKIFIKAGLPSERIFVKPNFVHPDPGVGSGAGDYVLFVGRLSDEKGIHTLLEAWQMLGGTVKLKIAGDGPMQKMVEDAALSNANIEYLGRQSQSEIFDLMKNAMFLVFPSLWYEGMPRVIIETFAVGTPVLAGEIGAAREMVDTGKNGYLFQADDPADLARQVRYLASDVELREKMRLQARNEYEANYTIEKNLVFWTQLQNLIIGKPKQ